MKSKNFLSNVFKVFAIAVVFLFAGASSVSAQNLDGTPSTPPRTFVPVQTAISKIKVEMPTMLAQLNALPDGTVEAKKKLTEVLAYREMVTNMTAGMAVSEAYNSGIQTLITGFNMDLQTDMTEARSATQKLYILITQ